MEKAKLSLKAYKGHLTRATNNSESLLKQSDVDTVEVEASITVLTSRWNHYDDAYSSVELLLLDDVSSGDEIDRLQTDYYDLQTKYQQTVSKLRALVKQVKPPVNHESTTGSKTNSLRPNLPSMQLPTFAGELAEYESFIDQFQAQIGSRPDLEPVTKLQYLKSQLKGRALELIKGYTSISANYQSALDTLKETYGDEEKIKQCLLQKMINAERPKHTKSELESFRVNMLNLTRSLRNKDDFSQNEWIIASIFQHKLPPVTVRQLYLKYEQNYFSLDQLNEGLRDLVSHMEVESKIKPVTTNVDSFDHNKGKYMGAYYSTAPHKKPSNPTMHFGCKFCGSDHKDAHCTKFPTGHDRIQRLKELNLCLRCMGKHLTKSCVVTLQKCRKCQRGNHHTTLCKSYDPHAQNRHDHQSQNRRADQGHSVANIENQTQTTTNSCLTTSGDMSNVASGATTTKPTNGSLATGIAKLEQTGEDIRVFFDGGSQRTLIKRNVVERAGIPLISTEEMGLSGLGGLVQSQEYVKLVISLGPRKKRIVALVVDELPKTIVTLGLSEVVHHLLNRGVKLADPHVSDDKTGSVDVLVGSDHYYDFISLHTTVVDGIHLLNTPGGYLITGKIPRVFINNKIGVNEPVQESAIVMKITETVDPLISAESQPDHDVIPVHKLWDLDVIGINPKQPSSEDQTSYEDYLNAVKYEEGQYWVKLPWKINKPELPSNYRRACGQMFSLVKELNRKGMIENYDRIIKEQLEMNFIEEVPEVVGESENIHYIPHHAVFKESETTPLRIVYNCSSRASPQEASLNDCLLTGPSLTKKLSDVLLCFRTNKYAFTADISKAFLRIGLQEADRNYTRFLWLANPLDQNSAVKTYRFKSVLFGATSSPFLLQATIDYHLKNSSSQIKDYLAANFYVDNLQGTTNDEKQLINIYNEANDELTSANMPLRKWASNHSGLQHIIEQDYQDYKVPSVTAILGLQWNIRDDSINLSPIQYSNKLTTLTKRTLLANVSKLFDPLGLFTPISMKGKALMQECWKLNQNWDDTLPDCFIDRWNQLMDEYEKISEVALPRSVMNENESCSLHIFCDASTKAYGAVAYLVKLNQSLLLTSKSRVTPIKPRTIPQLELTALLVGTRLAVYINKTLNNLLIEHTYLWSDSEVALQWVKNKNSKLPYVQNRVTEIQESNNNYKFMKIDTKENPADLLSRGTTLNHLKNCELWFQGPHWLKDNKNWPEQKYAHEENVNLAGLALQDEEQQHEKYPAIDGQRFSSLGKLIRVTRHVFSFINNLYIKRGWSHNNKFTAPTLFWIKQIQGEVYGAEVTTLSSYNPNLVNSELSTKTLGSNMKLVTELSKKTFRHNKTINQLGLYLDEGVIRCRGRIHNSFLEHGTKHPVLLPKNHWFSQLVIMDAHKNTLHGGVADTMITIRKTYWIPKLRQAIKTCIRKCTICQRYDARPLKYPGPPPLPEERVQHTRPFQVIGVDYTGAIQLQDPSGEDITYSKVYICLFTCATTRAVHLELAEDMTANTFLRLFRRFTARRSCPRTIISDNGSNFKATHIILKSFFENEEVKEFFSDRRCEWKFIPPSAPWQGGFYERMVGVVKKCLKKVLHNKRVNIDELRTVLTEIEARVNNRPLTYVQDSINEPEPLTPNHLLHGSLIETIPPVLNRECKIDSDYRPSIKANTAKQLNQRFNFINKILRTWNRTWHTDYLLSLREHHYGSSSPTTSLKLALGDIVLIDNESPRSTWPLGKVMSLLPDKSGNLRVVKVLSRGITSLRTIDKLIPLEVDKEREENLSLIAEEVNRPKRQAAIKARTRWQTQESGGLG